ncbi:helix-turn-helix domain-containing protein [Phycicoccus sp. MAQZ13P-2]|uniref:helix-turn-helix domain-containing protein n=1 Tax=Phycicoccus mangrovi TaxID=2840470 RepID=UPI001C002A34|nr:helix-turn-helix domain-containing protein [Phycicoccus mangrovi]MBT9257201.1 helix-turn-helix domain-containing protein [Phycicoccus mangrovi]MBT9276138.1 helix-turn-helix domain-containing protein [Phycicoccus mangrovi]
MSVTMERHLESLASAARRTGVSVKTLRRRVAAGELSAYRSGRLIRVEVSAVDALFVLIPTIGTFAGAPGTRSSGARSLSDDE